MGVKGFYFDVKIEGVALVYAETVEDARYALEGSGAMVAGNKIRRTTLEIVGEGRENP